MLIPLRWLEKYIKLKHTDSEFGQILTKLDSMQDGPIKTINNLPVIDLEVRQNRPDLLSIIGIAREYAAYIDEPVNYPKAFSDIDIKVNWENPDKLLSVKTKKIVKRFVTVEIKNLNVKRSPKWIREELESYGIPAINNIVDITNYVMLEYGMPLHAFDKSKLKKDKNEALLTLRRAIEGEKFETWQRTQLKLTKEDIVVADAKRAVAIAGVIGGANSGIDKNTKTIILESATYDHASVRRTAIRHNVITDASSRHSKFLNPNMSEVAVKRALYLIKELASGEIVKIEDYYNPEQQEKFADRTIDFDLNQIARLAGIQLTSEEAIKYLNRLGFEVIEQKESIGIDKHLLIIRIPKWRTDISYEEDIVEEIVRLLDYDNIPMQQINNAPQDNSTPSILILEDKIKDILVNLGYDEQITNPLCKHRKEVQNDKAQIKLENALTSELDGLRTSIADTLMFTIENNKKAGVKTTKVFESGKIYWTHKMGEYKEERRITVLTNSYKFELLKGDLLALIKKLGLQTEETLKDDELHFIANKKLIAILKKDQFELMLEILDVLVATKLVPFINIETNIKQRISEEISLKLDNNIKLGEIREMIKEQNIDLIESVHYIHNDKDNIENLKITFASSTNKLTRAKVNEMMAMIKTKLQNSFSVTIR